MKAPQARHECDEGNRRRGEMSVLEDWTEKAIPVDFVSKESWPEIAERLPPDVAAYARASGFEGKAGAVLLAPSSNGGVARVLFGVEGPSARRRRDPFAAGKLATLLPSGLYRLGDAVDDPSLAALAFLLSSYSFSRYRKAEVRRPAPLRAARRRSRAYRTYRQSSFVRTRSRQYPGQ